MSKKIISKSKSKIKAVLFDLGKVLVHFDFKPAFKRLAAHCDKTPREIELYFMKSGLEVLYDGGKIHSYQFFREVKKSLKHTASYDEFRKIWNEVFTLKSDMLSLLKSLKKNHRIVLISNTNAMHYEYIRDKYKFFHHFDRLILSYKEKVRKPDDRIYKKAMKACRAKAHEIFYIDDREDLTQAAGELGIKAFTFKNNIGDLKQAMKSLGML